MGTKHGGARGPSERSGSIRVEYQCRSAATLRYPWTARRNPAAGRAETVAQRWAQHHGLLPDRAAARRFDAAGVGLRAAFAFPDAEPPMLELCARVMAWMFIEDDRHDLRSAPEQQPSQVEARFERFWEALRTGRVARSPEPAINALADLSLRLMELGSSSWHARFVESMRRQWMDGVAVETYYRSRGLLPDPASYLAMRVQTVGIYPMLDLMELCSGGELPADLHADPIVRRMAWLTCRVVAYVNDLFSFHKEHDAGDVANFLHVVLQEAKGLDRGVDHVVQAHDRDLDRFCQLRTTLAERDPDTRARLLRYVDGCQAWMSGALRWHLAVPRYASGRQFLEEGSGSQLISARSA